MTEALQQRARELALAVRDYGREIDKQRKALEALSDESGWRDRATRDRARKVLDSASTLVAPSVGDFLTELVPAMRDFLEARRQSFVDELFQAVESKGIQIQPLGQQPPVFDVQGIQVEVDFEKDEARLAYGREALGKAALEPAAILAERERHIERLQASWPGAADFFDAFAAAYRARAARENKPAGERVFLVDLLPELDIEARLRGHAKPKDGPYDKATLAYALDRLAREGVLEKDSLRLELGTATGGSTKDKKRVLFLQKGLGGGQYYLTARVGSVR